MNRMLRTLVTRISLASLLMIISAASYALEIRIATVAPEGSYWMREMRSGGERIRELTEDRVVLKFYPGGIMGADSQVLRKIRIGQLQGGAFTASGLSERYNGLNIYGIPLLFRSLGEVDYVRERMDGKLQAGLLEAGWVSLGFSEGGFANLMSNVPVSHVDELRRKKVWVPEGDQITYRVMEALGLSPVQLPLTDVLTGLQTGLVDVVGSSPAVALVLQWHTRIKYRTDLPVTYSMGVFAIESRTFNRLSQPDQQVVREVMGEIMQKIDATSRQDNVDAEEVMSRNGVAPVPVNAADVVGWTSEIESLYPELRQRPDIDVELFDELIALLEEYRSNSGGR